MRAAPLLVKALEESLTKSLTRNLPFRLLIVLIKPTGKRPLTQRVKSNARFPKRKHMHIPICFDMTSIVRTHSNFKFCRHFFPPTQLHPNQQNTKCNVTWQSNRHISNLRPMLNIKVAHKFPMPEEVKTSIQKKSN